MRIISLNTWGGRYMHGLMNFIKEHKARTDIFCFQEVHDTTEHYRFMQHPDEWVRWDVWHHIRRMTPEFNGYFSRFRDNPNRMSVAILVHKDLNVAESGDFTIYEPKNRYEKGSQVISDRQLQYVVAGDGDARCVIMNYHGLWIPGGKLDMPERLEQSAKINELMLHPAPLPVVFCADMNLEPQTQSMKILEKGMRNLVAEYAVTSTRTILYRSINNPAESRYADYVLVSPQVKVNQFYVMPDIVSDHAPLFLDFSIV